MSARSLASMSPSERRRALLHLAARVVFVWVAVLGAYFILPDSSESTFRTVVRVLAVVALMVGVIVWQAHRILRADLPEIRAIEALGAILVVFLALFASLYLGMWHGDSNAFNHSLNHVRALYFTVTIFSTVGFGDITANTDVARGVVTVQMLLDLVLLGAVVRLLLTAVRSGLSRSEGQGGGAGGEPAVPNGE